MSNIEAIKTAIESLPEEEYVQLRQWFQDKDWESWDRQIEADSQAGKLDFLVTECGCISMTPGNSGCEKSDLQGTSTPAGKLLT